MVQMVMVELKQNLSMCLHTWWVEFLVPAARGAQTAPRGAWPKGAGGARARPAPETLGSHFLIVG
eukprot:1098892-Prymnesium_polylepis.1